MLVIVITMKGTLKMCSSFPNGPLRIVQNTSPDVSNQSVSKYLKSKRACAIGLLHHPWGGRRITRAPLAQYIVTHFKYLGHSKISSNIRIRLLKLFLPNPPSVRKNEKGFWEGRPRKGEGLGREIFLPSLQFPTVFSLRRPLSRCFIQYDSPERLHLTTLI